MKNTKAVFEAYLKRIDQLDPEKLGGPEATRGVSENDNQFLNQLLAQQMKSNNRLIIVALVLLSVVLLVALFLIFYYLSAPQMVGIIFGITALTIIGVLFWLKNLWFEKSLMDISLNISKSLPPPEAAKYIQSIYWGQMRSGSSASSSGGTSLRYE